MICPTITSPGLPEEWSKWGKHRGKEIEGMLKCVYCVMYENGLMLVYDSTRKPFLRLFHLPCPILPPQHYPVIYIEQTYRSIRGEFIYILILSHLHLSPYILVGIRLKYLKIAYFFELLPAFCSILNNFLSHHFSTPSTSSHYLQSATSPTTLIQTLLWTYRFRQFQQNVNGTRSDYVRRRY